MATRIPMARYWSMPYAIDAIAPGTCYVAPMQECGPDTRMSWTYQGRLRSYRTPKSVVKSRVGFVGHMAPESLLALLDEAQSRGVTAPSSYSSLFHSLYRPPRVSGAVTWLLRDWYIPGPWQALLLPCGTYSGKWYRYDIRSAYLSAALNGLPDPTTYRWSEYPERGREGVYLMKWKAAPHAPAPYTWDGQGVVSTADMERYGITGAIYSGITWGQRLDTTRLVKDIRRWSCWKHVARSYWGMWLGSAGLWTHLHDKRGRIVKSWTARPINVNQIWAHDILASVRGRVWAATRCVRAARVYVDSVIVDTPMTTGDDIGAWRLEATYNGLRLDSLIDYGEVRNGS